MSERPAIHIDVAERSDGPPVFTLTVQAKDGGQAQMVAEVLQEAYAAYTQDMELRQGDDPSELDLIFSPDRKELGKWDAGKINRDVLMRFL